jgi:hypothetical protein
MMTLDDILHIFNGTNGDATRALYAMLSLRGPLGHVALNLFRSCKASGQAKRYKRGGGWITKAYDKKDWSIGLLVDILKQHAPNGHGAFGESPVPLLARDGPVGNVALIVTHIEWGWGIDEPLRVAGDPHHHVLYIELPTGQVSFHIGRRDDGPSHSKPWDGARNMSAPRIVAFVAGVLDGTGSQFVPPERHAEVVGPAPEPKQESML